MPSRRTPPFFIDPDDSEEKIVAKLRDRFGAERRNLDIYVGSSIPGPRLGRPPADWHLDAYEQFRALRNAGDVEKVAAAKVAKAWHRSDSAIVKAMRELDLQQADDFLDALIENDAEQAAKHFIAMDRHARLRIAKWLRKYRK